MRTPRDINICHDIVFKAIFTQESPESRRALHSLLSAFLERELSVISVTANEPPANGIIDRRIRFDISVRFDNGELANVEMTISPQSSERVRIEYYIARLFISQDIRSKDRFFSALKPAYQLSFLDGNLYRDKEWYHRFIYYDPDRRIELGGRTTIITVELKKLRELAVKHAIELDEREAWAVFLKYYREAGKEGLIRELIGAEEGIAMAEQVIQGWSETEMENLRRMWEDMAILDHNTWVEDIKTEARKQQLLETARKLKAMGLDPKQIAAATGLSARKVAAL